MKTIIPIFMAIVALSASATAAEPEVIVELGSDRVYQGESVLYRVTLNNFKNPSPPRLEGFDNFRIESLGQTSLNSTFTRIINGRVTTVERRGEQYSYRLTPLKAGLLRLPAPTAKAGGKTISGSEKLLDVIAPDEQDLVIMELTVDRQSVYPMQPFELTLSILVKGLPSPNSDHNPVADRFTDRSDLMGSRSLPRNLQIPWLPDDNLPEGIEPAESWQRWLQPLQNRRGAGFAINNFGQRSVMSLFDEGPACFQPRPSHVIRNDADGKAVDYWQFDFKQKFIPKRMGRFTFGPVTFKGPVTTAVKGVQIGGEKVYALAPAITTVVNDVPEAGRPDSYIGAVGSFQLAADLKPRKAKVGDPMTLTLSLHGEGTLENATPPDLSKLPAVADSFKVYEASEAGKGSSRTFTYSIRPLKEGTEQFPAVPVSYF
ncbi:MAG: BatD family protein, partial [Thermoguttaceae bacterium]